MTASDPRPRAAIGHIGPLSVRDVTRSLQFYEGIGCRVVTNMGRMAILELRGGTHLILRADPSPSGGAAPFDLMVDDVDTQRQRLEAAGYRPSGISEGGVHRRFVIRDPDGWNVTITSSHAMGPV